MANVSIMDVLMTKDMDPLEFHFESLWIPPITCYLTPQDVEQLRQIATSVRLSSQIQKKYKMIDDIMVARGFKRFSAGTNRVVYRYLEDNRFLAKIAVDRVGMQDNPLEFQNQQFLQPFVSKMFHVSPCGTVGFAERVLPVKNKEEFRLIADDVFDIIINKILGLYVVEDIGTKYFMNWGIRPGFGPVLLDYPYVYKLDGNKLWCSKELIDFGGEICNGEIDYDDGFNHLVCSRCGKVYLATDLKDESPTNKIIITKGGYQMRCVIMRGDKVIATPIPADEVMVRPAKKAVTNPTTNRMTVRIDRPGQEPVFVTNVGGRVMSSHQVESANIQVPEQKTWSPDADEEEIEVDTSEEEVETEVAEPDISDEEVEGPDNRREDDEESEEEEINPQIEVNETIIDDNVEAAEECEALPSPVVEPETVVDHGSIDQVDAVDPRPMGTTQSQFNNGGTVPSKSTIETPKKQRVVDEATKRRLSESAKNQTRDADGKFSKQNKAATEFIDSVNESGGGKYPAKAKKGKNKNGKGTVVKT